MARFVLLHSPLLGPLSWRGVAERLRGLGHLAEISALPALVEVEPPYYPALAEAAAAALSAGADAPPVLVAHSGAGALLPALVERLAGRVAGAIFVDAILPHPGRSWFDTAPENLRNDLRAGAQAGLLPPWHDWWPPGALDRLMPEPALRTAMIDELTPIPAAYFEEAAPTAALDCPAAYLKLSDSYEDEARLANRQGWPLVRLPLHHLAPLTHVEAVALALQGLAERLATQGS